MVQVAHIGIAQHAFAARGVGLCAGAKIALDTSATTSCRGVLQATGSRSSSFEDMVEAQEARMSASPRRALRNVPTTERRAVREQRRLEIERELMTKLGLSSGDDGFSPNSTSSAAALPSEGVESVGPQSDTRTLQSGLSGSDARPLSRSGDRPGSARRAVFPCSSGPSRPPKPKPHRPLNLNEDTSTASGMSAGDLPQERRWKSALLPLWPDRQHDGGGVSPQCSARSAARSINSHGCVIDLVVPTYVTPPAREPIKPSIAESITCTDGESLGSTALPTSTLQDWTGPSCAYAPSVQHAAAAVGCSVPPTTPEPVPPAQATKKLEEPVERELCVQEETDQERRLKEAAKLEERTRQLEASAQRLRDNVERLRLENRRTRIFGHAPPSFSVNSSDAAFVAEAARDEEQAPPAAAPTTQTSDASSRRLEELRRKIAELDKVNELERQRLEDQQLEMEERQRQQEQFERGVQERMERDMRAHRDREARAETERVEREEEQQREREERERRRQEHLHQQEEKSRRLEELRKEGRSEAAQLKWQLFEEELDRQWAKQDEEERRRLASYARERRKCYEEWDRRLAAERQRFASDAEFVEAARHRKARNAANADEQFYGSHRSRGTTGSASNSTGKPVDPPRPPRPPPAVAADSAGAALIPEECAVLKELQSVRNSSRDAQKAKVKELLFRWHPDKNPACIERATRVFQFVQKHRDLVLGL